MTREQKILFLKKYRQEKKRVKSIELTLEELNTYILNISPKISKAKVQTSSEADSKLTELLTRKEKITNRLIIQEAEALKVMQEVMEAIDTVENSLHHAILIRHYISGDSLEDIAEALTYEYSWLTRLHKKAIDGVKI